MAPQEDIVVYSCITGGRDHIKHIAHRDAFRYVMFTDAEPTDPCGWEIVLIDGSQPLKAARYHKHNPQSLFPEARITIWIDGTHWPYSSLVPLLNLVEKNDIAVSKHYSRTRVVDEVSTCVTGKMDDVEKLRAQWEQYRSDGFQDNIGLYETSYLVRKHTQRLAELQELWWGEIQKHTFRDQISLPYCLWKLGMTVSVIPGRCRYGRNDFFKMTPHRKNPTLILR